MVDEWLLEHLAKVTTLSCVLIVIYFLIYSIWRISQMPNNPWNWNDWQWPIGGRHAVEIYRKRTEMPFTLCIDESSVGKLNGCNVVLSYLKYNVPPVVTVMWGPAASYVMRLINLPWQELNHELMKHELNPGEWKCLIDFDSASGQSSSSGGPRASWRETVDYFVLHRLQFDETADGGEAGVKGNTTIESDELESYSTVKLKLSPPVNFDWNLLKNQFRYPAVIFVTSPFSDNSSLYNVYEISGIIQIVHVKNDIFQNSSTTLAQYIKMNNGQSHVLQSLYVMDDHRVDEDEPENDDNSGATNSDLSSPPPSEELPFKDILCSVCQVSPVTRVIIPCRHVCLCTQCFEKVESCPICRGHIAYYFKTRQDPNTSSNNPDSSGSYTNMQDNNNESPNFTLWQRIEQFNNRFSDAIGLVRH